MAANPDLEVVTIRLRRGDKERLAHYYSATPGGYNKIIRDLVSRLVDTHLKHEVELSSSDRALIDAALSGTAA